MMKQQLQSIASILAIGTLCFAGNAFAVKADDVHSSNIKEADGTSGQDTNSGDGVKTGHIQDDAVTDAKISDVSMSKVSNLQETLDGKADNATVNALSNTVATKADAVHGHYYGNMTVVATSGGEYTSPVDAIADISSWCGSPSAANPCLVKVMPGVYEVGANTISLSPYVDLEGSGENATTITGTPDLGAGHLVSTIDNNEIRSITLNANTAVGGNIITTGVRLLGDSKMSHTTVNVSGGGLSARAYAVRISGDAEMVDVTLSATGAYKHNEGIYGGGSLSIDGAHIEAYADGDFNGGNYAIWLYSASNAKIRNAVVQSYGPGQNMGLYLYKSTGVEVANSDVNASYATVFVGGISEAKVANTKITGSNYKVYAQPGGLVKCFNNYDENYDAVVCP